MLSRALIVLLLVLNTGVALWWVTRSPPAPAIQAPQPADVPTLQLLREMPAKAIAKSPAPAPAPAPMMLANTPAIVAGPETCHAFGPFDDAEKADAARTRLQPQVARLHLRTVADAPARGWRVWVPPLADRAAAQAMAARIAAAGFSDYFIIANGGDANGIALGVFRSQEDAKRHTADLHSAGFADVRVEPLGAADVKTWIDVAAPPSFDPTNARVALGTVGVEPLDCASVP